MPYPILKRVPLAAGLAAGLAACASSGPRPPDQNPAIVAAVRAEPRVVSGDTTWVSRGAGYEIVAFTRRDIAAVDSAVARQSGVYHDLFGETPPVVVVSVHRVDAAQNGMGFQPGPPLPPGVVRTVVDVPLFDPARGGRREPAAYAMRDPTERVMRAWLSARATALTGQSPSQGATGLVDDPRVPAWAEALVPALAVSDTTVGRLAAALSAPNVRVYPVEEFFSMQPPAPMFAGTGGAANGAVAGNGNGARGGYGGGDRGGEGGEGGEGGGGIGGRGGFGGGFGGGYGGGMRGGGMERGGGMGGRGGRGEGRGDRAQGAQRAMPLRGALLFDAQATVLGRYLMTREGAPLIGQMVDARIMAKPLDALLASQPAGPKTFAQLDADWRGWLAARAERIQKR